MNTYRALRPGLLHDTPVILATPVQRHANISSQSRTYRNADTQTGDLQRDFIQKSAEVATKLNRELNGVYWYLHAMHILQRGSK